MSFKELGINDALCESIERVKWTEPTEIQKRAIPPALKGKDIIGLAKTGSGKTGAFTIPIIQGLMANPIPFYALIFTPTRDLALQIQTELKGLGKGIGVRCCTLIGGLDEKSQVEMLQKKPHVIIATPGRFLKHVKATKGFNQQTLSAIKCVVMDEADKMLSAQFEKEIDKILYIIPRKRQTLLFSATNTDKVSKLQRACLVDPVTVTVNDKLANLDNLKEYWCFHPYPHRNVYLVWILRHLIKKPEAEDSDVVTLAIENDEDMLPCLERLRKLQRPSNAIIFVSTKFDGNVITLLLHKLGLSVAGINGDMTQQQRIATLNKIKTGAVQFVVASDVLARGIDIHDIDLVINYDYVDSPKTYTHRIGRTARAGKEGIAISMMDQHDTDYSQTLETLLGREFEFVFDLDRAEEYKTRREAEEKNVTTAYNEAKAAIEKMTSGKRTKRRGFNLVDHVASKKRKI